MVIRQHKWQKYKYIASSNTINSKTNTQWLETPNWHSSTPHSIFVPRQQSSAIGNINLHRYYTTLNDPGKDPFNRNSFLTPKFSPRLNAYPVPSNRFIGGWVGAIARSVLKIRYLFLGGAIGGGASLAKQYEDWKSGLPDAEWIKQLFPSDTEINKLRSSLIKASENIKGKANEIDIDPVLNKVQGYRKWFEKRLNDAIQAADTPSKQIKSLDVSNKESIASNPIPRQENNDDKDDGSDWGNISIPIASALTVTAVGGNDKDKNNNEKLEEEQRKTNEERKKNELLQKKLESAQEELMRTQIRYQKELEKLEKENKDLKQRLLLKTNSAIAKKQIKKSLIDMYSEILDELSGYDSSYAHADHLPRVVVIGKNSFKLQIPNRVSM